MARPGPALFELIRGGSAPPSTTARPEVPAGQPTPLVRITPKPVAAEPAPAVAPTPVSGPAASTERPADRAWAAWNKKGSWLDMGRAVTVPMSTVLFVLAGVGMLLVVAWAVAYTIGKGRGEEAVKRDLGPSVKPEAIPLNQTLIPGSPKAPEPKAAPTVERKAAPPAAGAPVAGLNYYLLVGGLDRDSAQRVAQFLTQNGLPAGTAVDKPAGGSNNPGSYIVFATKGLTSEEYKLGENYPARAEVVGQAARLGKVWQRDHQGQTDFSKAYWKKF